MKNPNPNTNNTETFAPEDVVSTLQEQKFLSLFTQNRDLVSFSEICRPFHALSAPELTKKASANLLAGLQADLAEVQRLCEVDPELALSQQGTATDFSDRTYKNISTYQASLCTGDAEMAEFIAERSGAANQEKKQKMLYAQFDAIFPEGLQAYRAQQQANAIDFSKIVEAINAAPQFDDWDDRRTSGQAILCCEMNPVEPGTHHKTIEFCEEISKDMRKFGLEVMGEHEIIEEVENKDGSLTIRYTATSTLNVTEEELHLHNTLQEFRDVLTQRSNEDKVYNPFHLINAMNCYLENQENWNKTQRRVFHEYVTGFVQRFMSAYFAQGLSKLQYDRNHFGEREPRAFNVSNYEDNIFPLNSNEPISLPITSAIPFQFFKGRKLTAADFKDVVTYIENQIQDIDQRLEQLRTAEQSTFMPGLG